MANCDGTWQSSACAWKSRPSFPAFQHEISTPMLKSRGLFSKFGLFEFGFPHFQHGKMLKSGANPCGKLICAIFYMCLNVEFPDISPAKPTDKYSLERLSIEMPEFRLARPCVNVALPPSPRRKRRASLEGLSAAARSSCAARCRPGVVSDTVMLLYPAPRAFIPPPAHRGKNFFAAERSSCAKLVDTARKM